MASFDELYSRLNTEQRAAVDHIDGPMMVLAGAGTGKTQVLAMRIAKLLRETGVGPQNILCLTFTESGVAAMRNRLIQILGTAGYYVRVYTFHSFCNDVIADFPERFVYAKELEPLTDIERVQLFQRIISSLSVHSPLKVFSSPYFYLFDIIKSISQLKRENIDTELYPTLVNNQKIFLDTTRDIIKPFLEKRATDISEEEVVDLISQIDMLGNLSQSVHLYMSTSSLLNEQLTLAKLIPDKRGNVRLTDLKSALKKYYEKLEKALEKQYALIDVYQKYQNALRESGKYDFDDMILFVLKQFRADQDILSTYQEQYQYILVDEYQDTNASQNETVSLMGKGVEAPNIFVVGDDDQSIYRFQGASLENVLSFYQMYKEWVKVVCLTQNYRSQQMILNAADSVISQNVYRVTTLLPDITKRLTASLRTEEQKVRVAEFEQTSSELYWIALDIKEKIQRGIDPGEIAILYRNNRNAEDIVDLFERMEIPYVLEGGQDILQDTFVRQLIQLLRCIHDPFDDTVLLSVLHFSFNGFTQLDTLKITRYVSTHFKSNRKRYSFFEVIHSSELLTDAEVADVSSFVHFSDKLLSWKELCGNETLAGCVEKVLRDSGLFDYVVSRGDEVVSLNRFHTFLQAIKEENRKQKEMTYSDLISFLDDHIDHSIPIIENDLPAHKSAVHLMTAHKSKGLEYEFVYIVQVVDKVWGNTVSRDKITLPSSLIKYDLSAVRRDSNEDERRLFYVALTRGKQEVTISYSLQNNDGKEQHPSMFIKEIDDSLVEYVDTQSVNEDSLQTLRSLFSQKKAVIGLEEVSSYLRGLLQNYTLSATHLNNYLKCPRLFFYQNFIKIPVLKNKHMSLGTAVHSAIEELYRSAVEGTKGVLSKQQFLKKFEKELNKELLNDQDYADSLENGLSFLGTYYDEYATQLPSHILIEFDFKSHNVCLDDNLHQAVNTKPYLHNYPF